MNSKKNQETTVPVFVKHVLNAILGGGGCLSGCKI